MAKRTGEKYEAILDAAVKVIAENGYHQAQVSRIAKEAKVADGTIYLYFNNKEDVLISLFSEKMGKFIDDVTEQLAQYNSPSEQLYHLIRLHFENLEQDPQLAIVTQIELRQSNPTIRQELGTILKKYFALIDSVIQFGMETGLFRADLDIRVARKMIFGTLDETASSWIMNDRKYRLVDQIDPIHQLFVGGMGKREPVGNAK